MSGAGAKSKLGVCLVAAHPLFLAQFQGGLLHSGFRLQTSKLGEGGSVESLPEANVYVVDSLPHARLTEEVVAGLVAQRPAAAIIVMGDAFSDSTVAPLLELGVRGILEYAQAEAQLSRAIQAVACGGYWVSRAILGRMLERILTAGHGLRRGLHVHSPISRREREILDALLENDSNKEIATRLNISERTVKFHVSNLLAKYGVHRRSDLILLAYQTQRVALRVQ